MPPYLGAILIAGAIAGIFLWRDVYRLQGQAQQLAIERAQLSSLQRDAALARRNARTMHARDGADLPGGKPAIALLEAIEAAWSEDVCLLRVMADLPKSRMRLEIMAVSNDALFEFVAGLKQRFGEQVFVERQADLQALDDADETAPNTVAMTGNAEETDKVGEKKQIPENVRERLDKNLFGDLDASIPDVSDLRRELLPDATNTASGGPEDDPIPGAANTGGGAAPVVTTPAAPAASAIAAPSCTSMFEDAALEKLFAMAEPGEHGRLRNIFNSAENNHAKNTVKMFAGLLRAHELKIEADPTLSAEAKAKALLDVRDTATKYVDLLLKKGLGRKSPFAGAYYAGEGNDYKKVAHLNATLLSQIGANETGGGKALFNAVVEGVVQGHVMRLFEAKWGNKIGMAEDEFFKAMQDQSVADLMNEMVKTLDSDNKKGEKSFIRIALLLRLATTMAEEALLRSARKAAANAEDPTTPATPGNSPNSPGSTNPADPAANASAAAPAAGTVNNYYGNVQQFGNGNIINSFNSEDSSTAPVEGGSVQDRERTEGEEVVGGKSNNDFDRIDFWEDGESSSIGDMDVDGKRADGDDGFDEVDTGLKTEAFAEPPIAPRPMPRTRQRYDPVKLNASEPEVGRSAVALAPVEIKRDEKQTVEANPFALPPMFEEPVPEPNKKSAVEQNTAPVGRRRSPVIQALMDKFKTDNEGKAPEYFKGPIRSYLDLNLPPVELTTPRKDYGQLTGPAQPWPKLPKLVASNPEAVEETASNDAG